MIRSLRGTVAKQSPGQITVDVQGVGYGVAVPLTVWDELVENEEATLRITTYVREDRFELYGFLDASSRTLFEASINMSGVGPKLALEICSVPKGLLLEAINSQEVGLLTSIKGVGKKTAEKLLLDLKALVEKHPHLFAGESNIHGPTSFDTDAIAALHTLGYDTTTIMNAIKNLPADLASTEERVAAALRTL